MFPYEVWRNYHETLYLLTRYNVAVLADKSFFSTQRLLDDTDYLVLYAILAAAGPASHILRVHNLIYLISSHLAMFNYGNDCWIA